MQPRAPVDELTGVESSRFGVYVHFPYCLSKCPYCDFASVVAPHIDDERYTRAVLTELSLRAAALHGREVSSIFIGGGTPSLWQPASVARVLNAIASSLPVAGGCEITLEANPGAADAERFAAFRDAGVNRLSMGVQSFDAVTLKTLGRAHDGDTAVRAFEAAQRAGFDNISMDFIYGVHGQTVAQAEADARRAAAMGSKHLSAYALTLDRESLAQEVPLAKQLARGEVSLPPDETVVQMQRLWRDVLRDAGFERYEISNYTKPGWHSRHNVLYWTGGEYLALGCGATGFANGIRYANHRSAEKYLTQTEAGAAPENSRETLTQSELFSERVAMGLRLANGVNLRAACEAFGQDLRTREVTVRHLLSTGMAKELDGRLALTDAGFDVHSAIAARVM